MFDFVRKNNRLLQIGLAIVIVPSFILVGVQGYQGMQNNGPRVAEVADHKITQEEWDNAHRRDIERLQAQYPNLDASFFDTPEFKKRSLDALIQMRLMSYAAEDMRLVTPDARLQRIFSTDPQFEAWRNADGSINKNVLVGQNRTTAQIEAQLRQNISSEQVLAGITDSSLDLNGVSGMNLEALLQQREIQIKKFDPKEYFAKLTPSDDDLKKYYADAKNTPLLLAPEKADIQYVLLSADDVKKNLTVSKDEMEKYYETNKKRFSLPEERRASHILVKVDKAASDEAKKAAQDKAKQLLAEVTKTPGLFEELAKKNSDDPGSASNGGDLGYFGRGAMVPPFEDAAFSTQSGLISKLVQSDFGYHIIKVTGARGGKLKSFAEAEADIKSEIENQLAQQKFSEIAEQFKNTVFEQSSSLQPVATQLKLTIQEAKDVTLNPATNPKGPLNNPAVLKAIFDANNLAKKLNTEAIEVGPQQLISARVVRHTAAEKPAFDQIKDKVRALWLVDQALVKAKQDGEAALASAKKDGSLTGLESPLVISRPKAMNQPAPLVNAVMAAPTTSLPQWIGVDLGKEGYAIVKINKVEAADKSTVDSLRPSYAQAWNAAEIQAYTEALKKRYKVKISDKSVAEGSKQN